MAIDRLAYKLVMDHKQFVDGAVASRKELNLAKQVMFETQTPAQKYQKQIDSLGGLLRKGAIDQQQYNAAVKQLKNPAQSAANGLMAQATAFVKLNPALVAAVAGTAALYAAQRIAHKVVGEVTGAIKKQFEEVDRLAKLSTSLGIDTEDLATFSLIAGRYGTDLETFNKSLKTMQKNLGEVVALGTGEAKVWLEKLHVDLTSLKTLAPEDQFLELTDSIGQLPTQLERAAAAQALFGRGSQDVLRLLTLSKEGFLSARKEAEDFGLAINSIDAAKVEEANDRIGDLKGQLAGLARTVTVELAVPLGVAAEMLKEFVLEKDGVGKIRKSFDGLAKSLESIAEKTAAFLAVLDKIQRVGEVVNPITAIKEGFQGLRDTGFLPAKEESQTEISDFFDDFNQRIQAKKDEITARLLQDPVAIPVEPALEPLVGSIFRNGEDVTDLIEAGIMPPSVEAKGGFEDAKDFGPGEFFKGFGNDGESLKQTAKFAGAVIAGSQQDIAIRASASRGVGVDPAMKSAETLADIHSILRELVSVTREGGVTVSELSELPT